MKRRIKSIVLGLILALPFVSPALPVYADTATLYLSPGSGSVSKGSTITVNVRENSGGSKVNGAQANLSYPSDKLDFVSISSSSAFSVVAENSGGGGSVRIGRGALPSVSGDQLIASVKFRAKVDSGSATVSFADGSQVTADDGNGTNIVGPKNGATYSLKAAPAAAAPTPEAPKDTTPPVISDVKVTDATVSTVTITWKTSEPANSEINYGPTNAYGAGAIDAATVTDHKVVLSSPLIVPGTTYHFNVRSVDPAGNAVSSEDGTFKTKGATLQVTVVDQKDKPVSGAKVTFGEASATTDKNGQATLKDLPLGKQTGTISYKGKNSPATADITAVDPGGKPHTAKYKIEVSSDFGLRLAIFLLALAVIGLLLFYRRRRGGGQPPAGGSGGGVDKWNRRILSGLKGLLPKKEKANPPLSTPTEPKMATPPPPSTPGTSVSPNKDLQFPE